MALPPRTLSPRVAEHQPAESPPSSVSDVERSSSTTETEHRWRSIGFRLNPRRDYFNPPTVKEIVFKCDVHPDEFGTGQVDHEATDTEIRYIFKRGAKSVFGWDARESKAAVEYRKEQEEQQTL